MNLILTWSKLLANNINHFLLYQLAHNNKQAISGWWLNQPIWKKYATVKMGEHLPPIFGVQNSSTYLSCHHLIHLDTTAF